MPLEDAPRTFLIPISFVLLSAVNDVNPNNPRQARNMAMAVKDVKLLLNRISVLYRVSIVSSRKAYSNGK
jgi:hypothetical protein